MTYRSRLLAVSVLLPALVAGGACGRAAVSVAPAAQERGGRQLPAAFGESYVFLRSRVGGRPALLLFDSGASRTLLSPALVGALGLTERGRTTTFGLGATAVQARTFDGVTIEVGSERLDVGSVLTWSDLELPVLEGVRADGIIGADLLRARVVEIDWQSEAVFAWDTATVVPARAGDQEVRLTVTQSLPVLDVRALGRAFDDTVAVVVDYGSSGSMILDGASDAARRLTPVLRDVRTRRVVGVGGTVDGPEGRIDSIAVGGHMLRGPLVFMDTAGVRTVSLAGAEGLVGTELLRRFSMVLDYPRQRAVLRPTRRLQSPFCRNVSGICFERSVTAGVRVTFVEMRAPAARAGLVAGDELITLDGVPVGELSDRDLDQRLDLSGTMHTAEVRRASSTPRGPTGIPTRTRPPPRAPVTVTVRWRP